MATAAQFLSPNKNVLQQTNDNVPVLMEPKPEQKTPEKEPQQRKKRRLSQETENRLCGGKADANKLRKINIDFSSQKVCVQYPLKVTCYNPSSDETGEEEEDDDDEEDEEENGDEFKTRKPNPRPIIPNYVTKNDKGQYRKRRKSRADAVDLSSQKMLKPQASISIAKRNARERNRVKLVNQGFATLRSRIPDYISEIYTEEKKKKKVSKVETLRMALGYIRHLTEMLELRSTDPSQWFRFKSEEIWNNPCSSSSTSYPSPVDTEYQQSPSGGVFGSRDGNFYEYEIELETVKDAPPKDKEEEEKESLLLTESAFSVDVGCCYDLDKPEVGVEEPKKTPPLPSITESFPKKNLRAFYETPPFLSGSPAFHV